MKITQEEPIDRQTVLNIELEDEDLETYIERGYRRVVPQISVPGFRKGKAPRWRVMQVVGREGLLHEVLDTMLPELTGRAITEQELDAVGLPRIELEDMDPFKFKATVPLAPGVDLGTYKEIRVEEETAEYNEDDVQKLLDRLQVEMASWEPVDRPAKIGDMVTMSASATIDGQAIMDDQDAVYILEENSPRPIPGFAENLVGVNKEESKEFTLAIPVSDSEPGTESKEAQFTVSVSEIKERVLPELDDEFAKGVGDGHESIDALRQELEKQVKADAEERASQRYKESVVNALVEGTTVELPPLIVEHEVDHMEDERTRMLTSINIRPDDYLQSIGKTAEEVRGEMQDAAIERLKRTFALTKLSEEEGVEVTDEEVDERVESLIAESGQQSDQPITEDLKDSVRRMLIAEKTVDRLCSMAKGKAPVEPATESNTEPERVEEGETVDAI